MTVERQIAICIPEWVQPWVASYLMRCAACPNRVWVSTLMLEGVAADGIEPFCLYCARARIMDEDVNPVLSFTQAQVRYFAEHGMLNAAYDSVSAANESRKSLLRHLDDMVSWVSR